MPNLARKSAFVLMRSCGALRGLDCKITPENLYYFIIIYIYINIKIDISH